ncbi:hypothetical protein KAW53_08525, partial [Candidatus Bathyarchaeota archaeon]|nr:hypothetical protein [Candidatus Bathyarchaeota archaeon]
MGLGPPRKLGAQGRRVLQGAEDTVSVLEQAHRINHRYRAFNHVAEALEAEGGGRLAGVYVSVKDNVCVKGMPSTAGSKVLEGYMPPFDATVVA